MASPLGTSGTKDGTLPPFEVAKAYAFEQVLSHIEKHLGMPARQLLGEDKAVFIAKHLELEEKFPCWHPCETPTQFAGRMAKVQEFLNSEEFTAPSGGGLGSLARSLRPRCGQLLHLNGGRLRT